MTCAHRTHGVRTRAKKKVPLEGVVERGSLHYARNLDQHLLPDQDQIYTKPPRVMVPDGEWEELCRGLLAKRICGLIRDEDVFQVQGRPLLNGLFGAPKDEMIHGQPVCRLIMNLILLNRICRPVGGISTLPAWPSMHPFEIGNNDVLLVMSSEDARRFFYIFSVQDSWHRFPAFGRPVPPSLVPNSGGKHYLCSRVLPMGFCNSFSLAQHIHRTFVREAVAECLEKGGRAGWEAEHRKDRSFSWSNPSYRVYLDNFDLLEKVGAPLARRIQGSAPSPVEALRLAYSRRGVPRHPKKAVARNSLAEAQGAELNGEEETSWSQMTSPRS